MYWIHRNWVATGSQKLRQFLKQEKNRIIHRWKSILQVSKSDFQRFLVCIFFKILICTSSKKFTKFNKLSLWDLLKTLLSSQIKKKHEKCEYWFYSICWYLQLKDFRLLSKFSSPSFSQFTNMKPVKSDNIWKNNHERP